MDLDFSVAPSGNDDFRFARGTGDGITTRAFRAGGPHRIPQFGYLGNRRAGPLDRLRRGRQRVTGAMLLSAGDNSRALKLAPVQLPTVP